MSRDFWIVLTASVLLTLGGIKLWWVSDYPRTPAATQKANMERAEQHLPVIQQCLDKDARFKKVQLYVYTGLDGAIGVSGEVDTEEVFQELKKIVASTIPPRPVYWKVGRYTDNGWER